MSSILWTLLLLVSFICNSSCTAISEFVSHDKITNIVVDNSTGNVFIGGTNILVKTEADLEVLVNTTTGPIDDNENCLPAPSYCDPSKYPRVPTDNRNKLLLIDYSSTQLVTCGSIYHGVCQLRDLNTLSVTELSSSITASSNVKPAVGFIAPGGRDEVLYFATSWRKAFGDLYSTAYSISSLSLDPADPFTLTNQLQGSYLKFKDYTFDVRYIYGFSSGDFSYFLMVQETLESHKNKKDSNIYETKLGHVCHRDKSFSTYVEIPLVCKGRTGSHYSVATSAFVAKPGLNLARRLGITSQSDVLFVTFTNNTGSSVASGEHSALCYFSLKAINKGFETNIKNCSEGQIPLGMPWARNGDGACKKEEYLSMCNIGTSNYPISGTGGVVALAELEWNRKPVLTSVTAMVHEAHTAVVLGTYNGHLIKISVGDGSKLVIPYYNKGLLPGNVIWKLDLSKDRTAVYATTDFKVIKHPIQECSTFSTCESCSGRGDPFCGWCTLYNKCSVRSECADSSLSPLRFATEKSICVSIVSTNPDKFPYGVSTQLEATVQNLPPLTAGNTYQCYINNKVQTTSTINSNTVKCSTPDSSGLPEITNPTGDVLVELALYSSETGQKFVVKKIPFYDCTKMKGCRPCAESVYDCDWCTYTGKCSSDGNNACPGEAILAKMKRTPGAAGCPKLLGNTTHYVPNDVKKELVLKAQDLPALKNNFVYECVLSVEGKKLKVGATRDSDSQLSCHSGVYTYNAATQTVHMGLEVLWRGTDLVYKPESLKVLLYKCDVAYTDCGTCLNADFNFKCGWCKSEGKCLVKQACSQNWVHPASPCLIAPVIERFWPMAGPPSGGTELEIHGKEFGKSFSDIQNNVYVDNYPCIPDPHKYIISQRIVCNTTRSPRQLRGPVRVTVSGLRGSSSADFAYQTPELYDYYPKKGPQSGGTPMNITGVKLNTGRHIVVMVGRTPCIVNRTSVTDTSIPCVTKQAVGRSRREAVFSSGVVQVTFDGFRPLSPPGEFSFTADPFVDDISPKKTFPGGGLRMTVRGKYFESVQNPKMYYTIAGMDGARSEVEECVKVSNTEMICPSPNVTEFNVMPGSMNGSELIVGFIMDQVPGLENETTLAITENPFFLPFASGERELKEANLIIEGKNLDILSKDDVFVTVGGVPCNLTGLDDTQLVCLVPDKATLPEVNNEVYEVIVTAGYLKFNIGKVRYFKEKPPPKSYMTYIYIGVAAGGFVLLVVILCLVCAYRRKKRQEKRHVKDFEVRMDNLESKVAKECREAFAELQTDMTDLKSDLTTSGMPFLDFRTYALNVLFPGVDDHSVTHFKDANLSPVWEQGLRKFSQLIYNKEFLLIFVRTVESQKTFSMKDRCNLASLLMVTLQGKMDYATEILWQLLCDLIRKSVAQSHPKLLLRRTESVAEKLLTNWLAFCMYNHLKVESGEPLFMMFKAIKRQVGKGPVDAVTGEARYSLSEDKLLRQTIDYEEIRVNVTFEDQPPTMVTVLDCDSVSQAKSKMLDAVYKNVPFSSRVEAETLQLDWHLTDGSVKPLRDDDASSVVEGQWRKLNTLGHYKVTDGANLKLSSRQSYFYSSSNNSERQHHHRSLPRVVFSPFNYTPISRGSREDLDEGGRIWHLVKLLDYPTDKDDTQHSKMLAEIYLTRLLATKGTLQQFVDGLFNSMFNSNCRPPVPVKYLFDLLDSQAKELNLSDSEVLHTWKNNSLPLRFWINIVKNPNFIFDIEKSGTVDSCLSVIAQLFMDACSISEHRLGIHSPSNKLLYAKEIPAYKQRVEQFYQNITALPSPSGEEMADYFADLSMQYSSEFNADNALKELFNYATKYQDQLQEKLEESGYSSLASKLEHILADIENE
ncbi:plexin-A4 [Nematostella vectensis]|nr:plexin-A4 [Nematostella vectensis]